MWSSQPCPRGLSGCVSRGLTASLLSTAPSFLSPEPPTRLRAPPALPGSLPGETLGLCFRIPACRMKTGEGLFRGRGNSSRRASPGQPRTFSWGVALPGCWPWGPGGRGGGGSGQHGVPGPQPQPRSRAAQVWLGSDTTWGNREAGPLPHGLVTDWPQADARTVTTRSLSLL